MTDEGSDEGSALDTADAFGALSDPLRVEVLRALLAHHRETGPRTPAGFADLRRRVDVRDSGRFRYHLNELRDHFVEKTDGGYRLTRAGREVVAAVLAGTYTDRPSREPVELDSDCTACGEAAVARYEDAVCVVTCPNDHALFQWPIPPNAAADATLPTVVERAELLARQAIERSLAGLCPKCYGPVEPAVVVAEDARPGFRAACEACGGRVVGPVGFALLVDPRVRAFYRRHGDPLSERHVWEPAFVHDESAVSVAGTDPPRVDVAAELAGDELAVTVGATGHVTNVERPVKSDSD